MGNADYLREMAAWWRSWAQLAGDPITKRERLEWAVFLERTANKEDGEKASGDQDESRRREGPIRLGDLAT